MARRKSDQKKLEEGRGVGRSSNYIPWIKVHEFGSKGRVHRILGWKTGRIHHLLSDMELYYFLNIQWEDNVIDIREQFSLLPIENTISIAEDLGIKHPAINNKIGNEIIMTTDFVITVNDGKFIKDIVRTIKFEKDLTKRTIEKFKIEKEYFRIKGYNNWGIVTEDKVNIVKASNIYSLYDSYFWNNQFKLSKTNLNRLINDFINLLITYNYDVEETTSKFTDLMRWEQGEGLVFLKYLIAHKIIETNLDIPLNFYNMNIWLNKENCKY